MNIPWDLLINAFVATWLLSAICCFAVLFAHGKPEGLKGRTVQWITWPVPGFLVLLLMITNFVSDALELLLTPWTEEWEFGDESEDETDEDGKE